MGCGNSIERPPSSSSNSRQSSIIDFSFQEELNSSSSSPLSINDPIAIIDEVTLNPLGYSLWLGKYNTFRRLQEQKGASCRSMETLFEKQGLVSLEIIIDKGYTNIFKYYLPTFLLCFKNRLDYTESFKKPLVHKAIERGSLEIVKYTYEYFYFVNPPPAFDLHYIDPDTGENSALVACRTGNLSIIKYLHEVCGVNFSLINAEGLNSLHITISTKKRGLGSCEVIKYLIYHCQADVTYDYEKLLLKTNDSDSVKIIEYELSRNGIDVCKENMQRNPGEVKEKIRAPRFCSENSEQMITTIYSASLGESICSTVTLL